MKEIIQKVNEAEWKHEEYEYSGYEVVTNLHTYRFGIEDYTQCCESWGYITSEDEFDRFIGKELVEVDTTDKYSVTKSMLREENGGVELEELVFVTFKLSDGDVLQFAVYNQHNGYYGHSIGFWIDDNREISDSI